MLLRLTFFATAMRSRPRPKDEVVEPIDENEQEEVIRGFEAAQSNSERLWRVRLARLLVSRERARLSF